MIRNYILLFILFATYLLPSLIMAIAITIRFLKNIEINKIIPNTIPDKMVMYSQIFGSSLKSSIFLIKLRNGGFVLPFDKWYWINKKDVTVLKIKY